MRGGQVSATLNIVSVDLGTRTIVISRNSHCPVIVIDSVGDRTDLLDAPSQAIGIHSRTRPVITELPITLGLHVIVFTDGVLSAGARSGRRFDAYSYIREQAGLCSGGACARSLADGLLARAVELDEGRPGDDISVGALSVVEREQADDVRRMAVHFPI
jgi:serine phosphatase RsbU (regulator of sigma subunit)